MNRAPEPVFEAPWHAQLFALTVHLNEAGHFVWTDWAEQFSATLKRHGMSKELNGGEDYFTAWLETLEALLAEIKMADPAAVEQMRAAWEQAYLTTEHGKPVTLDASQTY
jgi:nitrile hydratase accessory protein